jgi:hypothetical protein
VKRERNSYPGGIPPDPPESFLLDCDSTVRFFFAPAGIFFFFFSPAPSLPPKFFFPAFLSARVAPSPASLFFSARVGPRYSWRPTADLGTCRAVPIIGTKNEKRNEFTSFQGGIPPDPPEFFLLDCDLSVIMMYFWSFCIHFQRIIFIFCIHFQKKILMVVAPSSRYLLLRGIGKKRRLYCT